MYGIERKAEILKKLEGGGEVDVVGLSEHFLVSKETIRRDLSELQKTGVLTRTHGGAVLNRREDGRPRYAVEYPVDVRSLKQFDQKNAICKEAASRIDEGDVLFLDNSSTTIYLLKYIPRNLRVTVITNSLRLLYEAAHVDNPYINYVCLGGSLKTTNLSCFGSMTLNHAGQYYPNKCFISCAGIRPDGRLMDTSMEEVETKRLMCDQSMAIYLLADYTKFTADGPVLLGQLGDRYHIVTDKRAEGAIGEEILKRSAQIVFS